MPERTRIGVIGAGLWGPHLIRNFQTSERSRVVAVAEPDPVRREQIGRLDRTVSCEVEAEALLARKDLDAVVVATPTQTHFRLSRAALERGLHVFVEKPLARTVADAESLRDLADRVGKVLFVGHVFLFNNGVRAARRLLDSGDLGRIHYLQSARTNLGPVRTDVSALWDLAPHDVSIFQYWLGRAPRRVIGKGGAYINSGIHDVVFATLEYPDGVIASLHVTWLAPHKVRQITVVGDRKMLVFDDRGADPLTLHDRSIVQGPAGPVENTLAGFRASIRDGEISVPFVAPGEPLRAECEHFLDCVRDGAQPLSGAAEGVAVVRILDGIERSLLNGSRETEILF
ncbi:MAG: Gfo/Idh/MocA family protein [Thermoanaerobaculia bacterium]